MFDMMKHYTGFDKILDKMHKNEVEMFQILIDKAKGKGEIRMDIDSLAIANHVHTLMHGILVLSIFEEGLDKLEEKIRESFNTFYQFIKN